MNVLKIAVCLICTFETSNLKASMISEDVLLSLVNSDNPMKQRIESESLRSQTNELQFIDRFSAEFYSSINHTVNRQESDFQPTVQDMTGVTAGLKQNLPLGIDLTGEVFSNQQNLDLDAAGRSTRSGLRATMGIDLLKNRWGRTDQAQLQLNQNLNTISSKSRDFSLHGFSIDVRKLYWSLVAIEYSKRIRRQVIESANRQLKLVISQKQKYVADDGDVARYESFLETQTVALINSEMQSEVLLAQLKNFFPQLEVNQKSILIPDLNPTSVRVQSCIDTIKNNKDITLSTLDAIIEANQQSVVHERTITRAYAQAHLGLTSMVEVNGLDNQYDSSIGELTSEPMPKFSIGIQFSMPLGSKKTFTEKQMILMKQLQYDADSANKRSMMQSQAEKTLKLIELLERALDAQRRSLSINEKKLEFSKRRFSQAREPLAIVIDDEIGLLNTKINAIQIQSQVVDAVLEYLRIFDKMQCKFS